MRSEKEIKEMFKEMGLETEEQRARLRSKEFETTKHREQMEEHTFIRTATGTSAMDMDSKDAKLESDPK